MIHEDGAWEVDVYISAVLLLQQQKQHFSHDEVAQQQNNNKLGGCVVNCLRKVLRCHYRTSQELKCAQVGWPSC